MIRYLNSNQPLRKQLAEMRDQGYTRHQLEGADKGSIA